MKRLWIAVALAGGLALGSFAAVHAKLPAPAPMSEADQAAKAAKAAAAKAKDAAELDKARDKAVANYKKNKGIAMDGKPAPEKPSAKKK